MSTIVSYKNIWCFLNLKDDHKPKPGTFAWALITHITNPCEKGSKQEANKHGYLCDILTKYGLNI